MGSGADQVPDEVNGTLRRGRGRPRAQAAILGSALSLVETAGVRNVTMEAIADRAGVSKITLYRRWPSKAALMADALMTELEASVPLDASKDAVVGITEHVLRLSVALDGRIGNLFRSVAAECIAEPAAMAEFRDRYLGRRRAVAIQIIQRGLIDGSIGAAGTATDCHDALYGAVFYRFLFAFSSLDEPSLRRLLAETLRPRPNGRERSKEQRQQSQERAV